jgi:ELP3 family radical SAM enzyme/protein acetyltransferase
MQDIENIIDSEEVNIETLKIFVKELSLLDFSTIDIKKDFSKTILKISKKYKCVPSKQSLGNIYRNLIKSDPSLYNKDLYNFLITKSIRSESGIVNVSVSLPPDKFSCKYNCHFCPNEPGMPRSYLSNEDVFKRAAEVNFDTVLQVYNRFDVLAKNGHPIDKIEYRVLGGTFSCYSREVADAFIRDLYYSANTYFEKDTNPILRERLSIEEEQEINITSKVHVVGLGVETRPDEIDEDEIVRFRKYGITRVELGVQHTDDALLRKVNRGHITKHSVSAVRLLKDYGFKVEIHVMTDLPGATPLGDMLCYSHILQGEDLIPDYMKDYPCLDVSFTKVKEWKNTLNSQGLPLWIPYAEKTPDAKDLKEVLIFRQSITPKWVRVNRIQRDFKPADDKHDFLGYSSGSIRSNLAQIVKDEAEKIGVYCQCIRCCEIRDEKFDPIEIQYKEYTFIASGQKEYFLTAEIPRPNRDLLLGFIRLRLSDFLNTDNCVIPELKGKTAMIRELHVYGRVKEVGIKNDTSKDAQHLGLGKILLQKAEEISTKLNFNRIAIISGIGVRDYYRKRGYSLEGTYMIKKLKKQFISYKIAFLLFFISIVMGRFYQFNKN